MFCSRRRALGTAALFLLLAVVPQPMDAQSAPPPAPDCAVTNWQSGPKDYQDINCMGNSSHEAVDDWAEDMYQAGWTCDFSMFTFSEPEQECDHIDGVWVCSDPYVGPDGWATGRCERYAM